MTMGLWLGLLTGACAAPVGMPTDVETSVDDPLSSDGKADGEPYCDAQRASIHATIHTVNIDVNVCHERGVSKRLEIGEDVSDRVAHERLGGDSFAIGCTVWNGEVNVTYGMRAEGHLYRIPVTEGQRVFAELDTGSHATLDLLERVQWSDSAYELKFTHAGQIADVVDDGGDAVIHEKDGERFVVVRVRPGEICPNADGADYELRVSDSPRTWDSSDER
jgi:hypothetical protein